MIASAARDIILLNRIRWFNRGVFIEIDASSVAGYLNIEYVLVYMLNSMRPDHGNPIVIERHQIEKAFHRNDLAVLVFKCQFGGRRQPLITQFRFGAPLVQLGARGAEQGDAQQPQGVTDVRLLANQIEFAALGQAFTDEQEKIQGKFQAIAIGQRAPFFLDVRQHNGVKAGHAVQ